MGKAETSKQKKKKKKQIHEYPNLQEVTISDHVDQQIFISSLYHTKQLKFSSSVEISVFFSDLSLALSVRVFTGYCFRISYIVFEIECKIAPLKCVITFKMISARVR